VRRPALLVGKIGWKKVTGLGVVTLESHAKNRELAMAACAHATFHGSLPGVASGEVPKQHNRQKK
jgi:hypothetical protein